MFCTIKLIKLFYLNNNNFFNLSYLIKFKSKQLSMDSNEKEVEKDSDTEIDP